MFTLPFNSHNFRLYIVAAFVILLVALTFIAIPTMKFESAIIPLTGGQNAYFDFLQGEKTIYDGSAQWSDVLSVWSLDEKNVVYGLEAAMSTYRQGEKDLP